MTEQPSRPEQPAQDDDGSRASVAKDVDRPEGGRTGEEISVDEAMGEGSDPD